MSWSGFKKNVGRATTQVMMKTGHVEKTSDREYEVEERRYRTLEAASLRLQKEAKGYLDSLRAMTASQMRIAETIDAFYGESGARDGVSRSYKQAVEDLDAETIKALDGPYRCVPRDLEEDWLVDDDSGLLNEEEKARIEWEMNFGGALRKSALQKKDTLSEKERHENSMLIEDICRQTVLEPINRFCAYFPDVNECIKKRNHKMLDYDAMRSKVKKLVEKPDKDPAKLPRTEKETEMVGQYSPSLLSSSSTACRYSSDLLFSSPTRVLDSPIRRAKERAGLPALEPEEIQLLRSPGAFNNQRSPPPVSLLPKNRSSFTRDNPEDIAGLSHGAKRQSVMANSALDALSVATANATTHSATNEMQVARNLKRHSISPSSPLSRSSSIKTLIRKSPRLGARPEQALVQQSNSEALKSPSIGKRLTGLAFRDSPDVTLSQRHESKRKSVLVPPSPETPGQRLSVWSNLQLKTPTKITEPGPSLPRPRRISQLLVDSGSPPPVPAKSPRHTRNASSPATNPSPAPTTKGARYEVPNTNSRHSMCIQPPDVMGEFPSDVQLDSSVSRPTAAAFSKEEISPSKVSAATRCSSFSTFCNESSDPIPSTSLSPTPFSHPTNLLNLSRTRPNRRLSFTLPNLMGTHHLPPSTHSDNSSLLNPARSSTSSRPSKTSRPSGHSFMNPSELEELLEPLRRSYVEHHTDILKQAKASYEQLNEQLTNEIPQLIDLRVPYLDPTFEALVKIQLRFCAEAYSRMAQVQQYLDASTRDQYASGELDQRVEDVLGQIRELSIAGTV